MSSFIAWRGHFLYSLRHCVHPLLPKMCCNISQILHPHRSIVDFQSRIPSVERYKGRVRNSKWRYKKIQQMLLSYRLQDTTTSPSAHFNTVFWTYVCRNRFLAQDWFFKEFSSRALGMWTETAVLYYWVGRNHDSSCINLLRFVLYIVKEMAM